MLVVFFFFLFPYEKPGWQFANVEENRKQERNRKTQMNMKSNLRKYFYGMQFKTAEKIEKVKTNT